MRSAAKRNRRKSQQEAAREKRQGDPVFEAEESEIVFTTTESPTDPPSPVPRSPPASPSVSVDLQYEDVLEMVQMLNKELGLINLDNVKIRTVCNQLLQDNQARDRAISDLTGLVKRSLDSPSGHPPRPDASRPHPIIPQDLMNLRATDIGITWAGPDTFLHGVKVVGPATSTPYQPVTSTPHQPTGPRPATSTPYQPATLTPYQPPTLPACLEIPDMCAPLRRAPQENRQGYRPAAPMQRFNNKSLNWPAWFRHFRVVADVHGWDNEPEGTTVGVISG